MEQEQPLTLNIDDNPFLEGLPFLTIIDFLEAVTDAPFENIAFHNKQDPTNKFPLTELLEFLEAECQSAAVPHLSILSTAQVEDYQHQHRKLANQKISAAIQDQLATHLQKQDQHQSKIRSALHKEIAGLRSELSGARSALKAREEEVAVLVSTLNQQEETHKRERESLNCNIREDRGRIRKRKKMSKPAKSNSDLKPLYGLDGADEANMSEVRYNEQQKPDRHNRQRNSFRRQPRLSSGAIISRSWVKSDELSQDPASWRSTTPRFANEYAESIGSSIQHPQSTFGSMPPPSPHRAFAPGLAIRKPKTDPYDPQGRLAPKDEYTFMRERQDAEVRGAWTSIDFETRKRLWDKRHHAEVAERELARCEGRSTSRASSVRQNPWSEWANPSIVDPYGKIDTHSIKSDSVSATAATVDARFEDPYLDIDPEVRERFIGVQDVLRENQKPLSAFEQRNNLSYKASGPVHVIIGGELVKTLVPKVDRRGELRDRHGNYVDGLDRGLMKKHFEEDRKRKIEERDEQMEQATIERRAWMALSPEERETRLKKSQKNKALIALLGAGVEDTGDADLYSYDAIPDVYLRRVKPESIARWTASKISQASSSFSGLRSAQSESPVYSTASNTPRANSGFGDTDTYVPLRDGEPLCCSSPGSSRVPSHHEVQNSPATRSSHIPSTRTSVGFETPLSNSLIAASPTQTPGGTPVYSARSESTIRAGGAPAPSILHGSTTGMQTPDFGSSSVIGSTLSTFDNGPELAPLQDTTVKRTDYDDGTLASRVAKGKFEQTMTASIRRGRIVTVRLHEPVRYGTSAIAQRLFGGVIQEIQYFPEERAAIVVFVYPYEATGFLRHVRCAKENDSHGYRQLQLDAEWYGGHEREAVYPAQKYIIAAAVGEDASRVLLINGLLPELTTAQFAYDLKIRFYDKILVKVAIVPPGKRYVQARDGNMGILEFRSIKDAMEIRERFIAKNVSDYSHCSVEYLQDSCDRRPGKQPYCDCLNCNGGRS